MSWTEEGSAKTERRRCWNVHYSSAINSVMISLIGVILLKIMLSARTLGNHFSPYHFILS